jgi:enamine deaminase RidA (YjgF/YER057c/UK114 family)
MHIEKRIVELGLSLPKSPSPVGNFTYIPWRRCGNLVFISGQLPKREIASGEFDIPKGKVGASVSLENAQQAALDCGLNILGVLKSAIGDLDLVKTVVKVDGFVNCVDTFTDHPLVINGCSDLFVRAFGHEVGAHARAAVGCNSLPLGVPVEIAAVFEVRE